MNREEGDSSSPGGTSSTGEGSEMRGSRVHIPEAERKVAISCSWVGQVDKVNK